MNALRRILQSTALLGLAALGARATAQTQSYVTKTKTVNAAVLLLDADRPQTGTSPLGGAYQYPQTAAPFAFYNLDQAKTIKPAGWVFTNPFAPGAVTQEIHDRYVEIYNSTTSGNLPNVGDSISKRFGPYWTVRLSQLSETQISDYNVLLIAPKYYLALTPLERERLRRFVDGGGVLWVDLLATGNGAGFDAADSLPFALQPQTNFTGNPYRDLTSPVIDGPKHVTDNDLGFLNPNGSGDLAIAPVTAGGTFNNLLSLSGEYFRYRNVASITNGGTTLPVIAEARLGDGAIVVTARGAAEMLNQGSAAALFGDTTNSNVGYRAIDSTPPLTGQGQAAARLAVNIASMGGNFNQPGGGTHNTSSANADPGSPVLTRFEADPTKNGAYGPGNVIDGTSGPNGTPVSYKGYLVETIGNRIVVYDAVPGRDLDGDGDPDDGISNAAGVTDDTLRDTSVGKPLDLVWVSDDLGSALSAPVCASVPEAGGAMADQILATDAAGNLHVFPLVRFTTNNFRAIGGIYGEGASGPGYKVAPPSGTLARNGTQNAPTVYDNLAYMTDTDNTSGGRVWVVDLTSHTRLTSPNPGVDWFVGGSATNPLPAFTASPTIGYIPASDSPGGTDRVLYAPGLVGTNSQPGFVSLWLGAKGETPATATASGGTLVITTHAGATSSLPIYTPPSGADAAQNQLAPHLTILKDGLPVSASTYVTSGPTNTGNGSLTYQVVPGLDDAAIMAQNLTFLVDYTIDWGANPGMYSGQIERGRILLPVLKSVSGADSSKRILGPIAMTTRGTLHMLEGGPANTTAPHGADSYFAIREDAGLRGQFRVVSRFTLYSKYTQTFGGSLAGNQVPAVLTDADAVQQFLPGYTTDPNAQINTFTQFQFVGGVAVRNGVVFAPIAAKRFNGFIPVAMLAAFRAEPETAELRLGVDAASGPRITQTDWARSNPTAVIAAPMQSNLSGNQLTVDADNGVVRIENLATTVRGEITDCISESQPIGVGTGSLAAYTFRQPDAVGDRWSPLLWFGLWNGGVPSGAPLVAGNSVFMPAQSALPDILKGVNPASAANSGLIWSVDADAPTTGPYAVPLPNRPWIVQQAQLSGTPGPDFASPYFRMPQNRGVRSFPDYVLRLNQTALGDSSVVKGIGGGDGVVAAWTDKGVFGLSRADFTVCDEGRLLRIDSAGNPVANAFGGRFSGVGNGGTAANERTLVRPVKAYPVGTNETLVVDAGANRIMRLDEDGTVLRSLDKILVDPAYKPANFRSGEPLAFKDPRDVATWEGYVSLGANAVVTGQQPLEYWVHYLVADSGNGRLVELVDRFTADKNSGLVGAPVTLATPDPDTGVLHTDGNGNPLQTAQVGVLVWQSPSLDATTVGGSYFNSVSRHFVGTLGTGRYVFVAGVARTRPTASSVGLDNPNAAQKPSGGGGGAIVVFDPLGGTHVYDRFNLPDRTTMPFLAIPPAVATTPTGPYFQTNALLGAQTDRPFTGVVAVTAKTVQLGTGASAQPGLRIMVSDADAIYEFGLSSADLANPALPNPTLAAPLYMIDERTFTALRSSPVDPTASGASAVPYTGNARFFRPAYARRLDSGDVIVVNGYRGLMRDNVTAYSGEVALLDGAAYTLDPTGGVTNLGFSLSSVRFELPPLTGIRGLVSPVFADRR